MKYWKILAVSGLNPKILKTLWGSPDSNNPNEDKNTKKIRISKDYDSHCEEDIFCGVTFNPRDIYFLFSSSLINIKSQ